MATPSSWSALRAASTRSAPASASAVMRIDLTHHGEDGDHNVSGMIVTAMRLVNAVHAVCDASPGLVFAKDLPPITGRGLVASPT